MARRSGPAHAIERRRGEIEQIREAGAQAFRITGEVEVVDAGEAVIDVSFPVLFPNKPAFSFGPELADGQPIEDGNLPTCSVVVIAWHERVRDDDTVMYVGAQFAIVTTGPEDQAMSIQWHMEGLALRGPVDDLEDE